MIKGSDQCLSSVHPKQEIYSFLHRNSEWFLEKKPWDQALLFFQHRLEK